jgi:acetoin utilization protein AcuC
VPSLNRRRQADCASEAREPDRSEPVEQRTAADRPLLVFGPWSTRYDLGPGHPLTTRRFGPGIDLLREVDGGTPAMLEPAPATDEVLAGVHDRSYIETVQRISHAPHGSAEAGIGPGDTPAFAGMHEAAAAVAGGSVAAMEAILAGRVRHAFHPGGGLHHAMRDRASGFCVYNDPALAIRRARQDRKRVLYVDLDVHHGDGVQALHLGDPGVLTVSIHQSGRTLFPGTGAVGELGDGVAAGTAVNLPLDPGTGEDGWLGALRRVLPELAAAFRPDLVVSQHGADAHAWDPLANLRVTTTAMGEAARLVDRIAHRWASGRWLATGGGGYDAYRVVPRAWALVWLAALHRDAGRDVPEAWRARWADEAERYGQAPLPTRLEDNPNAGLRPDGAQELGDRRAYETAALVRELVVPALVRAAAEHGWWNADRDLRDAQASATRAAAAREVSGAAVSVIGGAVDHSSPPPEILADVDPATWSRLRLAPRVLSPADPAVAHRLVQEALRSGSPATVSVAVSDAEVVGAVLSCSDRGSRRLLAVGVAPARRRQGLASVLLERHLGAVGTPDGREPWTGLVTVAERDPFEPLPRATRASVARRLFERAGFEVTRPPGPLGVADPYAMEGRRS